MTLTGSTGILRASWDHTSSFFKRFRGTMFNTAFWTLAIGVLIQNVWLQHELVGLRAVQAQGRPAAPKFEVGRRVVGLTEGWAWMGS